MADTTLNRFVAQVADAAARAAFVPSPPTPASGPDSGYFLYQQDTGVSYAWDSNSSAWVVIGSGSTGSTVPTTVQGDVVYASATNVLSALAKDTNATRYLANTGTSNNPAWAQVALTTGVTGTLPVANGGTGVSSGLGVIRTSSLSLTNAQILASPTTEYEVIPALGAGFAPNYLWSVWKIDPSGGDYTDIDSGAYAVIGTTGEAIALSSYFPNDSGLSLTCMNDWLTGGKHLATIPAYLTSGDSWGLIAPGNVGLASLENTSIKLIVVNGGSGNFTGGNAANTWTLTTYYTIESV